MFEPAVEKGEWEKLKVSVSQHELLPTDFSTTQDPTVEKWEREELVEKPALFSSVEENSQEKLTACVPAEFGGCSSVMNALVEIPTLSEVGLE